MAKINPLFQDSTISSGTNVRTQFELKRVFLEENHKIFLLLVNNNEKKYIELKCLDPSSGTYSCSTWLKHKEEIDYQFIVSCDENILSVSELKKGVAMYTVLETWEPSGDNKLLDNVVKDISESSSSVFTDDNEVQTPSGEGFIENLIEKWGL